jgi:outer membrane protein insertion porin family
VEVEPAAGSAPDKTVIEVSVEEKSTGSVSFGAGFSTTSGALGDVSFQERNLLGRGQILNARVVIAQRDSQISLSFTEPFFLNREIAAGFDVFRTTVDRQDESSFDEKTLGFAVRAGYPITENLSQRWRYGLSESTIENVPDTASIFIQEEEGTSTVSQISQTLTYDKRDSRIQPTDGYFAQWDIAFAGLGGNVQYLRNDVRAGYYVPVRSEWILELLGSAGIIDGLGDEVRLFDSFFVGGDNLRGFRTAGVGPRDLDTDDAVGGKWYYTGSVQLSFPLGLPEELPLRARVFADFGSLGNTEATGPSIVDTGSLRASVGGGVTWISPFGPIGLDFGFPVKKEDWDETETVRVNFGARF